MVERPDQISHFIVRLGWIPSACRSSRPPVCSTPRTPSVYLHVMLYRHVRIPFHLDPNRDAAVAASVLASSESVLDALEAYRKARRGERVALEVPPERIEWPCTTPCSN